MRIGGERVDGIHSKLPLKVVTRHKRERASTHLTVMAPKVEVDSLWCVPVPTAVTGGESHSHNSSTIACSQPALLVVAPPAHWLLLFALGHAPLPGEAKDVRVATKDWPMFHSCIHTFPR